jgi:hypothetical protein
MRLMLHNLLFGNEVEILNWAQHDAKVPPNMISPHRRSLYPTLPASNHYHITFFRSSPKLHPISSSLIDISLP